MSGEMAGFVKKGDPNGAPQTRDHEYFPIIQGTKFISQFYRLFKGTTLYDRNNKTIDLMARECLQVVNPYVVSENHLNLKIVRENFFFNSIRIPVQADKYALFKNFSQEMTKRWIGELEFTAELEAKTLKDFVFLLSGLEENNESNYLYIQQQLESQGIQSIRVGKTEFFQEKNLMPNHQDQTQPAKAVYFRSINLVKEVAEGIKTQKVINIRKAKHLMQDAVSSIMRDESSMLGLASIKNYDEYTFNHSVNVAIYAIALGQRIGIPKMILSHLGMAGLFHDIGKIKIPPEILNKKEKLLPEEWTVIRSHPVIGVEIIIQMKEWGELSTRMIGATFDHHLKYDLTGYPKLSRKRDLTLFGKVVALADFYDALVRPRVYRKFPYVSEKILGLMLEHAGKDFDPALVKVFINMIGIFPIGTMVLLNTNEMGIVLQTEEDPDLIDRPRVCLLQYSDGEYRKGKMVDLREMDDESRTFKRAIVKTLDPNEYNLNVAELLI